MRIKLLIIQTPKMFKAESLCNRQSVLLLRQKNPLKMLVKLKSLKQDFFGRKNIVG